MGQRIAVFALLILLAASALTEAATDPPMPRPNPRRGDGRSVYGILVPVQLTRVQSEVKTAQIICGVWKTRELAEKFEEKDRLGYGVAEVPLAAGPDGQFYIGPDMSVNIFAKNGKRTLRRGQIWACSLAFELEDGTVATPGAAMSSNPSALVAANGEETTYRPKLFGVL